MASPKKVTIDKMSDEILLCRIDKDQWSKPHDDMLIVRRGYVVQFRRHQICERCGKERTQIIKCPSMDVLKSRMLYPDEYLSDEGRLFVPDVRLEQALRNGLNINAKKH